MKHKYISLLVFLFFVTSLFGQKNSLSLLNDRFYLTFPDSAKNIARGTDIMSADPNANNETRVIYDIGDKRIVFFAQELYLKTIDKLEEKLAKESTPDNPFTTKLIFNADSVTCISLTPVKFNDKQQAILINSIIIKNADNLLSKLSVYLNPKAFEDKKTFDKITEQVFASFKKGSRRVNISARTESFPIFETKTTLLLKLPKDYIVTKDEKYDFDVYKIKKVEAYGSDGHADLVIYVGFHPSYFSNEFQLTGYKTADTDGEFMRQKTKWLNYEDKKRGIILREQLFVDDDIQKDVQIHIAMIAGKQRKIEELAAIVKDILIKYDK